ncbi:MAG: type II toxin-antitoxin system HipA family toxin [Lachnospiraceae bacterium]|nr:type II toxin-antitoxin system HipA family toxin [Lachnospiraceae bacterium]
MNKNDIKLGLKTLKVKYYNRYVGTLALTRQGKVAFSYDHEWLETGFAISPFSLPLEAKVFVPNHHIYEGLFGIFADSLPDAWGRLLLDRMLKEHSIDSNITVLDRLALVGKNGMGALEYEPDYALEEDVNLKNFDYLAEQCQKILQTEYSEELDFLYKMGGSSGGARPKILTSIDNKDWIIKFPAHIDSKEIGYQEYLYSECAKKSGIIMTETKLFPSRICKGYFGTVRFDRNIQDDTKQKIHMATAAGLLEADYKAPCMDYHTLMKLTRILTRENKEAIENMFRRMCFNVFAHNRDDHAKNFSFLYDEQITGWRLSPAYDLTYSNTYFGEHTTSVDGNGANPKEEEILAVGVKAGMKKKDCISIMEQVKEIVLHDLKEFL